MSNFSDRIADIVIEYVDQVNWKGGSSDVLNSLFKEKLAQALDYVPVKIWCDANVKKIPQYAHYFNNHAVDACCDIVATSIEFTRDGRVKCGTGIYVATEDRDSITIRPNSRITKKGYVIANSPCTIDESYRGEIFVVFRPVVDVPSSIKVGDVIGQLECPHHREIQWQKVDNLEDLGTTERGDGGFGSTENN